MNRSGRGRPLLGSTFPMTRSSVRRLRPLIQDHFNALLLLIPEGAISLGSLVQAKPVSDYKRGINISLLNMLEQSFHVIVHVGLAYLENQTLSKGCAKRN